VPTRYVRRIACEIHQFHWQEGKEASEGGSGKRARNQATKQARKQADKKASKQASKQTNNRLHLGVPDRKVVSLVRTDLRPQTHFPSAPTHPTTCSSGPLCMPLAVRMCCTYIGLTTGSHASRTTPAGLQRSNTARRAALGKCGVFCRLAAYNTTHNSRARHMAGRYANSLLEASAIAAHTGACDVRVAKHATHVGAPAFPCIWGWLSALCNGISPDLWGTRCSSTNTICRGALARHAVPVVDTRYGRQRARLRLPLYCSNVLSCADLPQRGSWSLQLGLPSGGNRQATGEYGCLKCMHACVRACVRAARARGLADHPLLIGVDTHAWASVLHEALADLHPSADLQPT
jgi:hypothetical protein